MTDKIRVGVLFGGRSGEHEVSLRSARAVMDHLDPTKYDIVPIGITKQGRWLAGGDPWQQLATGEGPPTTAPVTLIGEPGQRSLVPLEAEQGRGLAALDVIFPVLHGPYGEDGTMQGLFDLADIPYVGAGVMGSAVGMDKAIFKAVMLAHDIPILPYRLVGRSEWEANAETTLDQLEATFTYPMFVKPANLGSSVGVSRAIDRPSLHAALNEAARFDSRLVIEQGIDAREIEISVLGNEVPSASVPGEVIPGDDFYSYEDKYINTASRAVIPAELTAEQHAEVTDLALRSFLAIGCYGLARVDFLLERQTGKIYMNEVNTMPGFTSISMYPKLWQATGMSYADLLDRLIELAFERHADRSRNQTSYNA